MPVGCTDNPLTGHDQTIMAATADYEHCTKLEEVET